MELTLNPEPIEPVWSVSVELPFDWQWSKNRIWVARAGTHGRRLAAHARDRREHLTLLLRDELRRARVEVAHNRLFVRMVIALPDHHGDAVNAIDLALDAVERATGLDDRWVELRGLSWSIVPDRPRLAVAIGQTSTEAVKACGSCGEVLAFEAFARNRSSRTGRASACRACSAARRRRSQRPSVPPEPADLPSGAEPPPWA